MNYLSRQLLTQHRMIRDLVSVSLDVYDNEFALYHRTYKMMNGFLIRTLWNMMGMFEMFKWGYIFFYKFDCIEWISI